MIRFEFLITDDLFDPGNDLFFGKNRKHKTRKEEKEGNWLIMRNDWL